MVSLAETHLMSILTQRGRRPIPKLGEENADQGASVYNAAYGSMPIPATAYVLADTPLRSVDVQPSVRTVAANASVVQRGNRRNGIVYTGGRQTYEEPAPQMYQSPYSSKFQDWLMGPQVNYIQNNDWYIAYPAASVMFGGLHNLAWSERVPQLPTRISGGPGPAQMTPAPRFKSVQTVPRYSTMPSMYPTASASG